MYDHIEREKKLCILLSNKKTMFLMKQERFTIKRKIGDLTLEPRHDFAVNQWQHFGLTVINTLHPIAITRRLNISTERGPIFLQLLFEQSVCSVTVSLRNRENTKDGHQVVQFTTELVENSSKLFGCYLLAPSS